MTDRINPDTLAGSVASIPQQPTQIQAPTVEQPPAQQTPTVTPEPAVSQQAAPAQQPTPTTAPARQPRPQTRTQTAPQLTGAEGLGAGRQRDPLEGLGQPVQASPEQLARQEASVARQVTRSLEDIARRGDTIDEERKNQLVRDAVQRLGGQRDPAELEEAVNQRLLQGAQQRGIGTFGDLFGVINQNFQQTQELVARPVDQLAQGIESGVISPSQEQILREQDPVKYQEVIRRKSEIESDKSFNAQVSGKKREVGETVVNKSDVLSKIGVTAEAPRDRVDSLYDQYMNTDEIKSVQSNINSFDLELAQLDEERFNMQSSIQREFGTSIAKSTLNAITRDRERGILEKERTLLLQKAAAQGELSQLQEQGENRMRFVLQQQQEVQQALTANNGQGLTTISGSDLSLLVEQGFLEQADASILKNQQKAMTVQMLNTMGDATPQDILRITQGLERGQTPSQLLAEFGKESRFQAPVGVDFGFMNIGDGQIAVTNPVTGQVEFRGAPSTQQITQGGERVPGLKNSWKSLPSLGLTVQQKAPEGTWASTIGSGIITQIGGDMNGSGLDIAGEMGSPITTPFNGTVKKKGKDKLLGDYVVITTPDGKDIYFNHLQEPSPLEAGQSVGAFQEVGKMGSTGRSTGPHLDISVKEGGKWLPSEEIATYLMTGQVSQERQLPKTTFKTEAQSLSFGFANRMLDAIEIFNNLEDDFNSLNTFQQKTQRALPNYLKSSVVQQQEQAERNFLNAVLRRESGAAIADSEFANGSKQYFPMPGDSPEVLAQKKQNRETVIKAMIAQTGNQEYFDALQAINDSKRGQNQAQQNQSQVITTQTTGRLSR